VGKPFHSAPRDMTRADLIEEISRVIEIPRKETNLVLDVILGSMVSALRNGDKVEIRGFGSFRTRQRRGRIGRNPKSGQQVEVPPKRIPFFKPSASVLEKLNQEPPPDL